MPKLNFQGIFQDPGKKFQKSRSFHGIPGVVRTLSMAQKKQLILLYHIYKLDVP